MSDMNRDELRRELAYQREHFAHLVSDMELPPIATTRFSRWWLEWGEFVTTTVQIIVYTALVCVGVTGGLWLAIAVLTAL